MLTVSVFFLSQPVYAVSSIQISVDTIDAPAGQLKDAKFKVDLKGKQPKLNLSARLKAKDTQVYTPFTLECGSFISDQIGYIDCFDGKLVSTPITTPFSAHVESRPNNFTLDILLNGMDFSDEVGLHAGESLIGDVQLAAKKKNQVWHWGGKISWTKGEVYWQPFYFGEGGNTFEVDGTFAQSIVSINQASLLVNAVGKMNASAQFNTETNKFNDIKVNAQDVDFKGLYDVFLKPNLEKSAFGNLTVSGKASWQFEVKDLQPTSFELNLIDANIEDNNGKFAFSHMNAHIPWDYDEVRHITLAYHNGYLLNLPLGEAKLEAELNRYALTSKLLTLPLLDGALNFKDVSAAWLGENWFWHLRMDLTPVALNEFSAALGWPQMEGDISGEIPLITYANKQLNMDGAMKFNAFSGTIGMNNLRIDDPLGVVPRFYADLSMRKLDLGDLTRTFSFGAIEGKLDGDVKNMVLENWKPVYFDASLKTSNDKQLKKISQRAVENIAALGGQGAAAALQRSFLRFFEEFNYEKIGLSCQLRGDICEMGGVESTATGYIIVKGRGIPSVTVNGYTKKVSLADLLSRIKRITDSNSKVIVQ